MPKYYLTYKGFKEGASPFRSKLPLLEKTLLEEMADDDDLFHTEEDIRRLLPTRGEDMQKAIAHLVKEKYLTTQVTDV